MSFYSKYLPTFINNCTEFEVGMVNELATDLEQCGERLGADYAYISKNKTGNARPLTFAFYARGGKFLGRRTPNTLSAVWYLARSWARKIQFRKWPLFPPFGGWILYDLGNKSIGDPFLIIKSFNSPSEILSKIQESSDLGWREDEEKSIFISSFGNIQIIFNDDKNEIEINPIEETEDGWENMINWIHEEDKKIMEEIIEKFEIYSSTNLRELMEMDEDDLWSFLLYLSLYSSI